MKKRKDGRYKRTFTFRGRQYSIYGYSKKELDQKEYDKRLELESKQELRDNPTLDQYHEKWEEGVAQTVKESTIKSNSFRYKACSDIVIQSTGIRLGNMKLKEITVDEYYRLSPTTIDDNLRINASNMSEANYYDIGLDVSDGKVYVIARCDGP